MNATRISQLPDELLLDIFRDANFSSADLGRLALVSRKFLPDVQRHLYHTITVTLTEAEFDPVYDVDDLTDYSIETLALLETLKQHPRLASFVQQIHFTRVVIYENTQASDRRASGVETNDDIAIRTFFDLLPNLVGVHFEEDWDVLRRATQVLSTCSQIQHLSLLTAAEDLLHHVVPILPHLRSLRIDCPLHSNVVLDEPYSPVLNHLEVLDVVIDDFTNDSLYFLPSPCPSLRSLFVQITELDTLDLTDFPNLENLHITASPSRCPERSPAKHVDTLVRALVGVESLKMISFEDGDSSHDHASIIRNWKAGAGGGGGGGGRDDRILPNLTTLRFENDFDLEMISALLAESFTRNVRRIAVPYPKAGDTYELELNALKEMGLDKRIEVFYRDRPSRRYPRKLATIPKELPAVNIDLEFALQAMLRINREK